MLTERVEVWTSEPSDRRLGEGLLELHMEGFPRLIYGASCYNPVTFPACWSLHSLSGQCPIPGPLLQAWSELDAIRERLKAAEREAENG